MKSFFKKQSFDLTVIRMGFLTVVFSGKRGSGRFELRSSFISRRISKILLSLYTIVKQPI